MIEADLHRLMTDSEVKTGEMIFSVDFVLNLEVLDGCAHQCVGCFVNRSNRITDVDLDEALALAINMVNNGVNFREVIISPTDLFSANNGKDLLLNPKFQQLMNLQPKTRITSTAMFEDADWDNVREVFEILDNPEYYRSDMILEFLVPMNVDKVLDGDIVYLQQAERMINFWKNETPKVVDWSFVVNVYHDVPRFVENFEKLTEIAQTKFDTIIEFLPSFFRTNKDHLVMEQLEAWKQFLSSVVNKDNFDRVTMTFANKYHNSMNAFIVNYRKNQLYVSPFVYEQIVQVDDQLKINGNTLADVGETTNALIMSQLQYVPKTTQCSDCPYLLSCVGRNVLTVMERYDIKDCIYPRDVLQLYIDAPDVDARSQRVVRCASNK